MTSYIIRNKKGHYATALFEFTAKITASVLLERTDKPVQIIKRRPGEADQTNTYYPDGHVEREWEDES